MADQATRTIGAVCKALAAEFPDISISKIRFLEDQGLVTPQRSPGGYRLYGEAEVDRLRAVLTLQRDAFMPLRVIREELEDGSTGRRTARLRPAVSDGRRVGSDDLVAETGSEHEFLLELEEFGLLRRRPDPEAGYSRDEQEIVRVARRLATYGILPRHLRSVLSGAQRCATLVDGAVGPSLKARSPDRREHALEQVSELSHLLGMITGLLIAIDVTDGS